MEDIRLAAEGCRQTGAVARRPVVLDEPGAKGERLLRVARVCQQAASAATSTGGTPQGPPDRPLGVHDRSGDLVSIRAQYALTSNSFARSTRRRTPVGQQVIQALPRFGLRELPGQLVDPPRTKLLLGKVARQPHVCLRRAPPSADTDSAPPAADSRGRTRSAPTGSPATSPPPGTAATSAARQGLAVVAEQVQQLRLAQAPPRRPQSVIASRTRPGRSRS